MPSRLLLSAAISLTAFALIPLSPATAGDLYKWTDDKGQVHYSSVLPATNPGKAKAIDPNSLPRLNTLPSNPSADSAEGGSAQTSGRSSTSKPAAMPPVADSGPPAEPASPPALIPASLLPPSNSPAAKPEAAPSSDLVEVVAQGMGVDANAALLNAYSNAVQQALGSYVDAETLVQNDQIVRDKILTYSKGFIEKADIVSQNQANGLFQVNIRAKVKRQQLLEQAKANNISVKAVEGVNLHAKVMSQIKQEKDAKALLEKTLRPLIDATLLRGELAPSTQEQPNPTINKAGTNNQFVTLDYKVNLWIDESEYYKYLKNSLIPVLSQIATRKGELTANYSHTGIAIGGGDTVRVAEEDEVLAKKEKEVTPNKEFSFNILTWKDKPLTSSKWQWFFISKDQVPKIYNYDSFDENTSASPKTELKAFLCSKVIELSLLDENNDTVALGNISARERRAGVDCDSSSNSPLALIRPYRIVADIVPLNKIRISPYFTHEWSEARSERYIIPPRSKYFTISVKIPKEDLPRVKKSKLEVKSAGG